MEKSKTGLVRPITFAMAAALSLLCVAGCARRKAGGWFGWASVPACQAAIRGRALSEFGHKAHIDFEGVAQEENIGKHRVRVSGRAKVERKKQPDIPLTYECETNTKHSKIVSATYHAAD